MSCIFMSCNLVRHFHVLQFHALLLGPSFSCPAISCPSFSAPPSRWPIYLFRLQCSSRSWRRSSNGRSAVRASLQSNRSQIIVVMSALSGLILPSSASTTYIFFSKNHQSLISLCITSSLVSTFCSFRQPNSIKHPADDVTLSNSPPTCSPLSPSITHSLFHSRLKTHLFHKSFPQ